MEVTAGARYAESSALRLHLLGRGYRDLWSTPIRVPMLDLDHFGGGLTPLRRGGHKQTRSLRFRGADGREYSFRSVDKDVSASLPSYMQQTAMERLLQDQTSALLPASPVAAAVLLDAARVLHPGPRLVVLPDDPRLGEFRSEFRGVLGTIELHVDEADSGDAVFGAVEVVGTEGLLERLEKNPDHRVDEAALVRARLMDALLGDFDRHAGQWRWARYDRADQTWWVPVPEDRDHAMVHYDGLVAALARQAGVRRLIRFEQDFPSLLALMDNSLALNRRLLSQVPLATWDSVAVALQAELTDEVIASAVATLPEPYGRLAGAELVHRLRSRRDSLRAVAGAFFRLLSVVVEVHGTDGDERVEIAHLDGGGVEVRVFGAAAPASAGPRLVRSFQPGVTSEVRVFLRGGDDRADVSGGRGAVLVRVIGGGGDDTLQDRSAGRTAFHDHRGENRITRGERTRVYRAAPRESRRAGDPIPRLHRDWGSSYSWLAPSLDWRPHAELVVGAGPRWTRYGYGFPSYASRLHLRALEAPLHGRGGVELEAEFRRRDSDAYLTVDGRISNLEATAFHGLGNDSRRRGSGEARVWHDRIVAQSLIHLPLGAAARLSVGPLLRYTDPAGQGLVGAEPYRDEPLGQVGARAVLRMDTRDDVRFPRRGARLSVSTSAFPALWDVHSPYARFEARGSANATLPLPSRPVLAARLGGSAVLGSFPFYDAAFLGGSGTLRGYSSERFAGDRAAFAGVELRVPLLEAELLVRGSAGASLLTELGRVWLDGASPGGWHTARGAGVWFTTPPGTLALTYVRGERDRLYLKLGVPF